MPDEGENHTSQGRHNSHSECNEESQNRRNVKEILQLKLQNDCKSRKAAFTEPSRGMSEAKVEQTSAETLSFRCVCERCRLMRGEVNHKSNKAAFTLAEVLITLGIIGVVAALTLPNVIISYKNQVTIAKLKKAYSTLSQVAQKSVADNGSAGYQVGELVTADKTKEFFDTYWLPYFKGVKVYPNNKSPNLNEGKDLYKLLTSGFYDAHILTQYTAGRILFTSSDGIMYNIHILDWVNKYDDKGNLISQTGVYSPIQYAYVDINGLNPPNTLGKDVFFFAVDFDKMQVLPYGSSASSAVVDLECKRTGVYCPAKIMRDGWKITY